MMDYLATYRKFASAIFSVRKYLHKKWLKHSIVNIRMHSLKHNAKKFILLTLSLLPRN